MALTCMKKGRASRRTQSNGRNRPKQIKVWALDDLQQLQSTYFMNIFMRLTYKLLMQPFSHTSALTRNTENLF